VAPKVLVINEVGYLPLDDLGTTISSGWLAPVRTRQHHTDFEQELRRLGIDLWRLDHSHSDSVPAAASLDDDQHPRRELSVERASLDFWKKPLFDTINATLNYEAFKPRVSLDHWFADDPNFCVTGFGSVLYAVQDDFFVGTKPIPQAINHIRAQLNYVDDDIRRDGRVQIARSPREVDSFLQTNQRFLFHTLEGGLSLGEILPTSATSLI